MIKCWTDQERLELRSEFGNVEVTSDTENVGFGVGFGYQSLTGVGEWENGRKW